MKDPYTTHLPINDWAEHDRPREKMMRLGRRTLSDAELMAVLIGSGTKTESAVSLSRRVLDANQNCLDVLATKEISDLMKFKGIGMAKAVAIVAALEVGRRRKTRRKKKHVQITGCDAVFDALKGVYKDLQHEEFWILLLNGANRIIEKKQISSGGRTGTMVDAKLVFEAALSVHSNTIVLSHNHPSGNLKPSKQDLMLTQELCMAGHYLNVKVLDHLIFAGDDYYSFMDNGDM